MTDELDDTIDSGWLEHSSFQPHLDAKRRAPRIVSNLYRDAAQPLRARMLRGLLSPLNALSLVGVAAGAFSNFLTRTPQSGDPLNDDVLSSYTPQQIAELTAFVEDVDPSVVASVTLLASERRAG